MSRRLAVALATGFLFSSAMSFSQNPQQSQQGGNQTSGQFPGGRTASQGPRPYSEIITSKAKTDRGLFITHRVDDKFYFEIPDEFLGREILVVNRISKAPAGARAGHSDRSSQSSSLPTIAVSGRDCSSFTR